jgi:hypothetical protein
LTFSPAFDSKQSSRKESDTSDDDGLSNSTKHSNTLFVVANYSERDVIPNSKLSNINVRAYGRAAAKSGHVAGDSTDMGLEMVYSWLEVDILLVKPRVKESQASPDVANKVVEVRLNT